MPGTTPRNLSERAVRGDLRCIAMMARALARDLPSGIQLEDLVQAGALGMLESPACGDSPLSSAAGRNMRMHVRRAMRDEAWLHGWSRPLSETRSLGNGKAGRASSANVRLPAGDAPHAKDSSMSPDRSADPAVIHERACRDRQLAGAIAELPAAQRCVLFLSLQRGFRLREIGEVLGVSESRVSQIRTCAVAGLRKKLGMGNEACDGGESG